MPVQIIEKNDTVSYEQIHELLYEAHSVNRKKGFHVCTAEKTGEELQESIGPEGKCFLAVDGDQVVGVTAVNTVQRNRWYAYCPIACQILVGVLPEYQGKHISSALHERLVAYVKEKGLPGIESQVAYNNQTIRKACKKWGFRYVGFDVYKENDHYTVIMYKWINGRRPSSLICWIHYYYQKFLTIVRYKPGKILRFSGNCKGD